MNRDTAECRSVANESELERIAAMTPLDRQLFGNREDELLSEQDAIEFQLGNQDVGLHAHWSTFMHHRSPSRDATECCT
jgi:hypothetical protein